MRAIVLAIAVLALFACTSVAQETAVAEAPRFAEAEHEDAASLAEQEAEFDSLVSGEADEEADESELEGEEEEEAEEEDQADEEVEDADEAEEESEETDEADEEADESDEAEEESEEESDEEAEDSSDYVLAELKDNAVMTGFMEMIAKFIPTAPRTAEHMVHSLSSHQQAAADQQYAYGYAHGHADAMTTGNTEEESDEETDVEADGEGEETEEASFVEGSAKAETDAPVYTAQYYAGYPSVGGVYYQPHYPSPMPPQLPTWLPPPPYITPVAPKSADE